MFWYGALLALVVANFFPGWVGGLLFVIALLASGLLALLGHDAHSSAAPYVIVAVLVLLGGLYFGRMRGLRQLGESDFRTRMRNVRGINRWL